MGKSDLDASGVGEGTGTATPDTAGADTAESVRSLEAEPTEVAQLTNGELSLGATADTEEQDQFVGRVLANRYKILKRLGTGGFGAVFEAEDTKIRKRVAVKVMTRDLVTDSAVITRFRKEAEAAGKVGHENIVDITDFDRTLDGHYFMAMEYLDGVDLGRVLRSGEQLSIGRSLSIVVQICRALNAAHGAGVVHRDLKPANIYLTGRGDQGDFVKLLDFGISKFMEVDEEGARLTRTGQIIGTPLYMAPEQARGEEHVDHRADIYSVGVILYELLTGGPPFTAVNYLGIIAQHATEPPVPPSKRRPEAQIPPALEAAVLRAMEKQPEDRFATMAEMEAALLQVLATVDPAHASLNLSDSGAALAKTGTGQPAPAAPVRRSPWGMAAFAVALLGGVGLGVWLWPAGPQPATVPGTDARAAAVPDAEQAADSAVPTGDAAAATRTVRSVRLVTTPPRARVFGADGKPLGVTPLTVKMAQDAPARAVTVKLAGHRSATVTLDPRAPESEVRVELKRRQRQSLPDDPKGWDNR